VRALRNLALGGLVGGALAFLLVYASGLPAASQATVTRFGLTGSLVAKPNPQFADEPPASLRGSVFVPGITVTLSRGGATVQRVRTDLSGRFVFAPQPRGSYQLCWAAPGWLSKCTKVALVDRHRHLLPAGIAPVRRPGFKVVSGTVRFKDGSLPRALEPLANVNAFAVVRPLDGAGKPTAPLAYVNNQGEYVLPSVSGRTRWLRASIENEARRVLASLAAAPGVFVPRNVVLANTPPRLVKTGAGRAEGIAATALSSGGNWTVVPGEKVRLTGNAVDPNGDGLRYRWILPSGASILPSVGGRTVTVTIPNAGGTFEYTLVAFDRRGGYATEKIELVTRGVLFGGGVVGADGPVLSGAQVEVNGRRTRTDAAGRFVLHVVEADRYVLNIRHPGYSLVSRIYDNSVSGGLWEMIPASVVVRDPTLPIDVIDERQRGDCPGALSDRKGPNREPTRSTCGSGFRISMPADALVDAAGNPPTGSVQVEVSTIDLRAPEAMPGDYGAVSTTGAETRMESFGAGTVEIRSGGREYNLRPGVLADIAIPIEADRLAVAPAAIPLLQYDEQRGLWIEEGVLSRAGDRYVGQVAHFSAINADLEFTNYSCVRVETPVMPGQFKLEAKVSPGTPAERIFTATVDNSTQRFHTIWRLPPSTPVELRAFDASTNAPIALLGPGNASVAFIAVNSGGVQTPLAPALPAYPYTACRSAVELVPFRLPAATRDTFLAGLYSFNASNLRELDALDPAQASVVRLAADRYYDTIDPQDRRTTLAGFRLVNLFGGGTGVEFDAQYSNAGDLGFGRDMNCHKNGLDVACYVTNYGNRFTDNITDAQNAARDHALPGSATPVATVGMEYSRVENPTGTGFQQATGGGDLRIVKFYVWVHDPANPATTTRANAADLDGYGPRPVPALCMVCHGGRYPTGVAPTGTTPPGAPTWNVTNANSANLGSNFIPFDFLSFELPTVTLPSGTTINLRTDQEADFKALNQQIVLATNPPTPTVDVINRMYAGGSTTQITNFVVTGWQAGQAPNVANQETTYRSVVAPSCRSCHISQGPSTVNWDRASQLSGYGTFIESIVCGQHKMPHAVETHNRFWLSLGPHQPQVLEDFLSSSGSTLVGACTP
jgi:hypothetical protein